MYFICVATFLIHLAIGSAYRCCLNPIGKKKISYFLKTFVLQIFDTMKLLTYYYKQFRHISLRFCKFDLNEYM